MIKTVGLETARKLKAAGFPVWTHFCWALENVGGKEWEYKVMPNNFQAELEFIAAPTAEELLEQLPDDVSLNKIAGQYAARYFKHIEYKITSAEALAELWLWLKTEGLLK